jgi:Putative peptidoglycan binding domain
VPSRKAQSERVGRGRGGAADSGSRLRWWLGLGRRLGWGAREAVAILAGVCAAVAIVANALFLQSGPHPSPFFASSPPRDPRAETTSAVVAVPRARPVELTPAKVEAQTAAPNKRVIAMQRALAQFGYGQIKATGIVDGDTRAAIERFERDHKLPVTGQPSDRLARELAAMTGRPLD